MGYNTTVVIMNDTLGYIEQDPDFGKELVNAIRILPWRKPAPVSSRGAPAAARVIETHHNRDMAVVAIGGNTGVVIGSAGPDEVLASDSAEIDMLRELARNMGYRLVKLPERKR
jgi:hypothetical protein